MKRILSLSLVLMMVFSLFAITPLTVSAEGTEENPIIINQDNVSSYYNKDLNGYYKVEGPVTFTTPINSITNGVFDGNGQTITLAIANDKNDYPEGLFRYAGGSGNTVEIKNLTLEGTVSTTNSGDDDGSGSVVGKIRNGKVIIDGVTNNAAITVRAYAGGIAGWVVSGEAVITNCVNNADVEVTYSSYASGIVGYAAAPVTIINCKNYKDVTIPTGKTYAAGIISTNTNTLKIENCANEGTITGDYIAGIVMDASVGKSVEISKTYNAGTLNGTGGAHAYGITRSANGNANVTDCYNVGDILVTKNGVKTPEGYMFSGATVNNFYNTKNVDMYYTNTTLENVYTLEGTAVRGTQVTDKELKELASSLGESFVTATPTKNSAYPYPQIVGNEYVVAAASVPATLGTIGGGFSANEDISGTYADGEISYTGAYVAGFGIAQDLFGWEKSYGMILTDANGVEYEADAVANSATESGNYGVLFYGSKLVPGEYTLTPYVTYTNYGETHQVKGEAKTVTVAE